MGLSWLITGGCGFIGTNLIKSLVSEGGHSVRVIDNLSVGSCDDLAGVSKFVDIDTSMNKFPEPDARLCQLVVGDILDENLVQKSCHLIDVIVHLAGNTGVEQSVDSPMSDCMTNVVGTLNLLEAARSTDVRRFIFASSGAPIGECEPPIHEELPPHPVSPYGASKLACEGYCSAYYRTYGLETVVYRFGNVYGPGSAHKSSVVAKFIKYALNGKPLVVYGNGEQTRDFIYVNDLVSAIHLGVVAGNAGGEIFQIATNRECSLKKLIDNLIYILEEFGISDIKIEYSDKRIGDVNRNYSDTNKAHNLLGWHPAITLEEGLKQTVNWYLNGKENPSIL